jgi:hypothetical protein
MTKRELIEALAPFEDNAEILIDYSDLNYLVIREVKPYPRRKDIVICVDELD